MVSIPENIRVILLDIEGTTTPMEFVHTTLFDYARKHIRGFLERFQPIPEVKSSLADLKRMHSEDTTAGRNPPEWNSDTPESDMDSMVNYSIWLIDNDSKAAPLKHLEGLMWEEGYRSGELRGEVYPDVPRMMARWVQDGFDICIYSSGSVFSQQMLFGTTRFGDLMKYIRGYFDTAVGNKREAASYTNIATILGVKPEEILFFSDSPAELTAASKARLKVILVERDGSLASGESGMETIADFDALSRTEITD